MQEAKGAELLIAPQYTILISLLSICTGIKEYKEWDKLRGI